MEISFFLLSKAMLDHDPLEPENILDMLCVECPRGIASLNYLTNFSEFFSSPESAGKATGKSEKRRALSLDD